MTLALDPTDIETNEHFGDAGTVTRKKKSRDRCGRMTTVETRVHGFRLIVDGEIMSWVREQGVGFVIPGKQRMDVVNEARQRMCQARAGTVCWLYQRRGCLVFHLGNRA